MKKTKILLDELMFYKKVKRDLVLAEEENKNRDLNTVIIYDNVRKMKYNIELVKAELSKSLKLVNAVIRAFEVTSVIYMDNNERIILDINSIEYIKFKNVFKSFPNLFNQYQYLNKEEKINGDGNTTFRVIISNRNILENYYLLKPVYNKKVMGFQYKYPMSEGIMMDVNDFQFIEEKI